MAKNVFFTFDDGPKSVTGEVLDVLKAQGVVADFFLTGSNVISAGGKEKQKALVEKILAEGHGIANHCFKHFPAKLEDYESKYGDMITADQKAAFKKNLDDNETYFQTLIEKPDLKFKFARLPGDGRNHQPSVAEVGKVGLTHIGWDYEYAPNGTLRHIGHKDWQGISGVACTFEGFPPNNNVVLVHDSHWAGKMDLLTALLKKLKDNGHAFKKIG